jgi:hypothetical protein
MCNECMPLYARQKFSFIGYCTGCQTYGRAMEECPCGRSYPPLTPYGPARR